MSSYEPVIGLEVHCQLSTRTKLFCGCSTEFGLEPNTQTCALCLGHPGVLPSLNEAAVRYAVRVGLALGCEIDSASVFARKHYFYPDLPKAYQVTQYDRPICQGGAVPVDLDGVSRSIALTRIHLEEDAGKSIHTSGSHSEIDLNRAGTPLIEVVSTPTITSADEAVAYLKELRNLVRTLGVCDGHMEQGSFRCDANVSVHLPGTPFGTRVELKNLNSFGFIKRAIEHEIARQIGVIESGGAVAQETRLWDEQQGRTRSMRGKEDAHDYRYFPDPDLPTVTLTAAFIETERAALPELPTTRRARYRTAVGLSDYDAEVLTSEPATARFFEAVLARGAEPKTAANWVASELKGRLNADARGYEDSPVSAEALGTLLERLRTGRISGKLAKDAFSRMYGGEPVEAALAAVGETVTDTAALEAEVQKALDATPREVEAYLAGKTKVAGFFVGQVMKATQGKASPPLVGELVSRALEARRR
jgi:aspartyl-tRNA(Asn)/glutamyl-tRNA(Gln) amidotransferase subunit B